ncbi:MAG: trypsin-like peptidase domain-containing protein [SAR86 cluster bacterium]|jgi:serine protease DegS|nr:trypsin-like peptidase domain-containing protein [SAR86 cluster bacterium]
MKFFLGKQNRIALYLFIVGMIFGLFILSLKSDLFNLERNKNDIINVYSYSNVVEKSMPSVVNIYSKRLKTNPSRQYRSRGLPFNSIFGSQKPFEETSLGSGVIFSADGYLLTNLHVIGNKNTKIIVELADGRKKEAKVIGVDVGTDLAVLKIESSKKLPSLEIGNSDVVKIGDIVLAIGNPYGVGRSVSLGIISATGREYNNPYSNYIQTDAAINKGNSGGALIDAKGRLIGINTLIRSSSGGSEGIGLAIPSLTALEIFSDLVKFGEVRRGWIGFNIDPASLRQEGILTVNYIHPNSPADKGNLKKNDVIKEINGKEASYDQLFKEFVRSKPGQNIKLGVERDGKNLELNFVTQISPN